MSHPASVDIDSFFAAAGPILDVRSPGEFEQAHIPGAVNFPLFTNEERAQVGTCYKQKSREAAIELGFDLLGPKLGNLIRQAKALASERQVRLHCWRGGMRSSSVAWALNLSGFQTVTLTDGYKAYRQWVRRTLATPKPIVLLGGMTGTAKTEILHALADLGSQVLDLEGHANHRGSSYGALCMPPQPSTEQFENLLAREWAEFSSEQPIWIEAESRSVGSCRVPPELFDQMAAAFAIEITRPVEERVAYLASLYGQASQTDLIEATERIRKRLGGDHTQKAIAAIEAGDAATAIAITLDYYDRTYRYGLEKRLEKETPGGYQSIPTVCVAGLSPQAAAKKLVEAVGNRTKEIVTTDALTQPVDNAPANVSVTC